MNEKALAKQEAPPPTFQMSVAARTTQLAGFTEENQFRIRFPREGKIHLGVKVPKMITRNGKQEQIEYPTATDHFVLPPALLMDTNFREALEELGEDPERPKRLPVWLPSCNIPDNIVSSYDRYSKTRGLLCRSTDGITALCRDEATGASREQPCLNAKCEHFVKGDCFVMHRLRVMLPDAGGVGVWQIDTKSPNNWGNLSCEMTNIIGWTGGKLAGLDLILSLEPEDKLITYKDRTGAMKQSLKTVHLMHLRSGIKLRDLKKAAAAVEVDWDMSDVDEVDTEFDVMNHVPPEAQDADFDSDPDDDGSFVCGIDPEELREELLDKVRALNGVYFNSPECPKAFLVECQLDPAAPLAVRNVDQLQVIYDALSAKGAQVDAPAASTDEEVASLFGQEPPR